MGKELLFSSIQCRVNDLLVDVQNGRIGLPDLQRPFVWKDNKVRDLLDSMMKGYPVGYIMLWSSRMDYENTRHIGKNEKRYKQPDDLVIDGQQRLTALLAAICGIPVWDKNYKARKIRISYQPLTQEFAVWTAAHEKDTEWISEISQVFAVNEEYSISRFRKAYIRRANEGRQRKGAAFLTEEEEEQIEDHINRLLDLGKYQIPVLQISSHAGEEDVAEIFTRVNSGGQTLTEKNFIDTLLAVYDHDVHERIHAFCAESRIIQDGTSYNRVLYLDRRI